MNPPKMPIHIGDYMRDTGHLRAAEHGAYVMLLFHYWSTGSLPSDDRLLAAIARMSAAEWKRARPIIEAFFDPGWRHGRVEKDLAAAHASYKAKAKAGAKGGKATADAKQNPSTATADAKQNPSTATASAKAELQLPYTLDLEPKKDAADAAPSSLEKQLFERGRQVAGNNAGGLIAKLLKAKKGDVALARAAVETASTKQHPREYLSAIITGGTASTEGRRLTNDEEFYGVGRIPGII